MIIMKTVRSFHTRIELNSNFIVRLWTDNKACSTSRNEYMMKCGWGRVYLMQMSIRE